MKKITKDTILLFIYSFQNIISSTWPVIYPYLASYTKNFNSTITMKGIFACTISIFIGRIIGGIILPFTYFLFGIKITMQITIFILFINYILFFVFTDYFWINVNIMLSGVHYQFVLLSVSYFLSTKYSKGFSMVNYASVGSSLGIIFWGFVSVFIINPSNDKMNLEMEENGEIVNYFEWEIAKNFKTYLIVLAFQSFLFLIPTFFLTDPKSIKPNFFPYMKALFSGNKRALKELTNSFSLQKSKLQKSIISNEEKSFLSKNSIIYENSEDLLLENGKRELSFEEAKIKSKLIMKNPLFILLISLFAIRFTGLLFFVDNYKIISYKIIKNDKISSFALSISVITSISGQLLVSFLWEKLDFYKSQLFLYSLLFINLLIIIFFGDSPFVMFWIISFVRICVRISYGLIAIMKFALFNPKIGIEISKLLDIYSIISIFIGASLNYFFDISFIFWVLLVLNIVGAIVFFLYFKGFQELVKRIEES